MNTEKYDKLLDVFVLDDLSALTQTRVDDLKNFFGGGSMLPDEVGERLGFLIKLIDCLTPKYSNRDILLWFVRSRPELQNMSPAFLLAGHWAPHDVAPQKVLMFAKVTATY